MRQETALLYELEFRDDDYPFGSEAWCDAVMAHREMLIARMGKAVQELFNPSMPDVCSVSVEIKALIELAVRSNWRMKEVVRIKIRTPPRSLMYPDEKEEDT